VFNRSLILDVPSIMENTRLADKGIISNKAKEILQRKPKRTILVVDDSLTTRELEKTILETAGYIVDVAFNGSEALEKIEKGDYSLIVSDVDMPVMDVFTFTRTLKENTKFKNIPVIIVTSKNSEED